MEWRFEEISPQTVKVDPRHIEFFKSEALDEVSAALTREDIQNRLDASSANGNPVRVRYFVSGSEGALSPEQSKKWLSGLKTHLDAEKCRKVLGRELIDLDKPMQFITIEDFETTGLRGDPLATRDPPEDDERNDFYWFIRNVGRTQKKEGDRGRWGLGKIVYPASSQIRSFLSYSISQQDPEGLLIGRAVLQIHSIDGTEYQSEGFFAEFPDSTYPYFAHPSHDQNLIAQFVKDFKISRKPGEFGLSLVIPFANPEITADNIALDLLNHYFWVIMQGLVEITVEDAGGTSHVLTKDTLDNFIHSFPALRDEDKKNIRRRIEFCQTADRLKVDQATNYFELKVPCAYDKPNIRDIFKDEGEFSRATDLFQSGEIVAFEVAVEIRKMSEEELETPSFWVFLQKDPDLDEADESYIREGLTIIGEKNIKLSRIRSLLLAEDGILAEFLGDAENPAHTEWRKHNENFKGKYYRGGSRLDYIRHTPRNLANALSRIEDQRLPNLLDAIFGIPDEDGHGKEKKKKKKRGREMPVPTIPEKRIRNYAIGKLEEKVGFKVGRTGEATRTPKTLKVKVAYDVVRGNPFANYHPADFNLADLQKRFTGCQLKSCSGNLLVVDVQQEKYSVEIHGFDPRRDLKVDVRAEYSKEEDNQ